MPAPHQSTPQPAGSVAADQPVDTRTSIFQILRGKGLTPNQALGIMYSMGGEGGTAFDPNAIGDGKSSYGWGQWHAERADQLMNVAKQMGTTWNNPSTQLQHFQNEINGPYAFAIEAVKKGGDSTADATRIWTGEYERPKVNNWQQRMGTGAQAFSVDPTGNLVFKPGAPSSPGANPAVAATPGATAAPTVPATSGAQDFAEAMRKGDVGGALAALNKGKDEDKGKGGLLGNLGDQLSKAAPQPQQAPMAATPPADDQGGRAQAGQALLAQVLQQGAQPLTWSVRPFGSNAGPQVPGTTLNSGY